MSSLECHLVLLTLFKKHSQNDIDFISFLDDNLMNVNVLKFIHLKIYVQF